MKIMFRYRPCGPSFVNDGWARCFAAAGHQVAVWDASKKSAFDAFGEYEPDLFLGTTFELDNATEKCIRARHHMKVVLYASAFGHLIKSMDLQQYPIVAITDGEKRRIEKLKRETGKPDFVHLHVPPSYLESVLGGWREIGVTPIGILNGADTFAYSGGERREEYACDVAFVGGFWGYKSKNLSPYMLPLCHTDSPLKVRIMGNQPWPITQYVGTVREEEVRHVFASARVAPNVTEPHGTNHFSDLVERLFKVPIAGGLVVSDAALGLDEVFGKGVIPSVDTPAKFREMVRYYAREASDQERNIIKQRQRLEVLSRHTYFHRTFQVFRELGLQREADQLLNVYYAKYRY